MRKQVLAVAAGITGCGALMMSAGILAQGLAVGHGVNAKPQEVGLFLISFGMVVFTLELLGLAEPIGVILSAPLRRRAGLPPIGDPEQANSPAVI